jgi:hypothetical protein
LSMYLVAGDTPLNTIAHLLPRPLVAIQESLRNQNCNHLALIYYSFVTLFLT